MHAYGDDGICIFMFVLVSLNDGTWVLGFFVVFFFFELYVCMYAQ